MTKFVHILALMFVVRAVVAQTEVDTILTLEVIEISSVKIMENTTGQKVILVDSLFLKNHETSNLSEILAKASGIQVKSYNSGGLSTISFRGTSAQHTGIFWHGFNLNQVNSGMIDLSLIPITGFDRVEIIPGGGASLFGSGNIGGSIHLVSEPVFNGQKIVRTTAGAGSFGEYDASLAYKQATDRWFSNTQVNFARSENNFEYTDFKGQTTEMQNNAWSRYGVMQDLYRKFNRSMVGIAIWYTFMDREIPTSITGAPKDIEQSDRSFRGMVSYQLDLKRKGDRLEIKSGYFNDWFQYNEKNSEGESWIDTRIKTQKSQTEAMLRMNWKNTVIKPGLTLTGEFGDSDSWGGDESRLRGGAYVLLTQNIPAIRWRASLNIRQEITEGYVIPLTPALGADGAIFKWLSGKVNVSRNYRIPTFNELFWVPGGNPDLKPEDSWNEELSLVFDPIKSSRKIKFSTTSTLYSSQVKNWVLWVPVSSWSEPQNIQSVWARGVEAEAGASVTAGKTQAEISGGYTYSHSTVEEKDLINDASYHKQLVYVPLHRFFANFYAGYRGFILSYNHRINGMVYTSSDNLESLPGFQVGEFNLSKTFNFKNSKLRLQADIKNVWDEDYQVVENYPNAGRSFKITASYEFSYH